MTAIRLTLFLFLNSLFFTVHSQFNAASGPSTDIYHFAKVKSRLFAASYGLYYSDDNGDNWKLCKRFEWPIKGLHVVDTSLIISLYYQDIYLTNDLGTTFTKVLDNNTTAFASNHRFISFDSSSIIFTNNDEGVFVSTDKGKNWMRRLNGLFPALGTDGKRQYATNKTFGTPNAGNYLLTSTDLFKTYTRTSIPKSNSNLFTAMTVCDSILLLGSSLGDSSGIFRSTDFGATWEYVTAGFPTGVDLTFREMYVENDTVYATTAFGVYYSINKGISWNSITYNNGYHNSKTLLYRNYPPYSYAVVYEGSGILRKEPDGKWYEKNNGIRAGIAFFSLYGDTLISHNVEAKYSVDGHNWYRFTSALFKNPEFQYLYGAAKVGSVKLVSGSQGIYKSLDNGNSWTLNPGYGASVFYKGKKKIYNSDNWGAVYSSLDTGTTWQYIKGFSYGNFNYFLEYDSLTLFASTSYELHRSTDGGKNWQMISEYMGTTRMHRMGDYLIRNTALYKVMLSKDKGNTWEMRNNGITSWAKVDMLYPYKNMLIAGVTDGIYITTDTCLTWEKVFPKFLDTLGTISDMQVFKNKLMIAADQGVFYIDLKALDCMANGNSDGCGKISGIVYMDQNENCLKDNSEIALNNNLIKIEPGTFIASTDSNGYYEIFVPEGGYDVSSENSSVLESNTCSTSSYHVVLKENKLYKDSVNFSKKILQVPEVSVGITCGVARVGFKQDYFIDVLNSGPVNANGKVGVVLDTNLSLVSSYPAYESYHNDTLYFKLENLEFQKHLRIYLIAQIPPVIDLRGQTLTSHAFATIPSDPITYNNYDSTSRVVTASYDPNTKYVNPIGEGEEGYIEPSELQLNYTIHFQNVGTDTAFTVIVTDTLSSLLDAPSFKMGMASHNYKMEIRNGNILKWTFSDIKLPDSTTNNKGSQGFLKFYIKQKESNKAGQVITNKADIFFDFNPPVRTDTTINTLRLKVTTLVDSKVTDLPVHIYPNPTSGKVVIQALYKKIGKIEVLDALGSLMYADYSEEKLTDINLAYLPNGLYFIKTTSDNNIYTFKVYKAE